MAFVCKYIALYVPDLRAAQSFYGAVLGVELLFRETERDGEWWTLPPEGDRDDVAMVALRRDDLVLALFRGTPRPGAVHELSIGLDASEIDAMRQRPPEGLSVLEQDEGYLRFEDPFGFRWVLQRADAEFRSSGQIAGRWLDA